MTVPHNQYHKAIKPLAEMVFKSLSNGFSTTVVSAPKVGKSSNLDYIIKNVSEVAKEYEEQVNKSIFINLSLENDFKKEEIEQRIKEELKQTSIKRVVLILDNSQLLLSTQREISSRLFQLSRIYQEKLLFIFLFEKELPSFEELKLKLGDLFSIIAGNINYLGLLDSDLILQMTTIKSQELTVKISDKTIQKIASLSGGHPGLMRVLLREYAKNSTIDFDDISTISLLPVTEILTKIWDSLLTETQRSVINDEVFTNEYLLKTGMKKSDGAWFSKIFSDFILITKSVITNKVESETRTATLIDSLTGQEYSIYKALKNKIGFALTRDEIAVILWGKEWSEKYSDWAIEQHISQIRKKLKENNSKHKIKTVYNKGFQMM